MSEYVPDIQECLRNRYPVYREAQTKKITLSTPPTVEDDTEWTFYNGDSTSSITLTTSFVTFSTSDYSTFEDFSQEFEFIIECLNCANLGIIERLGLRYVDLIQAKTDEPLSKYLKPPLHGFEPENVGAVEALSRYEFIGKTEHGKIVIRCTESVDGRNRPKDLENIELHYKFKVTPNAKVQILDFDHFSDTSYSYDTSSIIRNLSNLHEVCDQAFWNLTTDYARKQWGEE